MNWLFHEHLLLNCCLHNSNKIFAVIVLTFRFCLLQHQLVLLLDFFLILPQVKFLLKNFLLKIGNTAFDRRSSLYCEYNRWKWHPTGHHDHCWTFSQSIVCLCCPGRDWLDILKQLAMNSKIRHACQLLTFWGQRVFF